MFEHHIFVEASLQQVGAIWEGPRERLKQFVSIVQLDAANAVMGCKLWGEY